MGEGNLEFRLAAIRQMPPLLPEKERAKQSVFDASTGGYLRIEGKVYRVEARYHYMVSVSRAWTELVLHCLNNGALSKLIWRDSDPHSLSLQIENLSLEETGISKDSLSDYYEEERGSFVFRGRTYKYSESNKATFCRSSGKDCEDIFYWDFEGANGAKIHIRRWRASEYAVSLFKALKAHLVEVLLLDNDAREIN